MREKFRLEDATKHSLSERLESVRAEFSQKIESAKSELRKSEEAFKSELQDRDRQIKTLTDAVLSVRGRRQEAMVARRLRAIDQLWIAVARIGSFRAAVSMMASIDFQRAVREVKRDQTATQLFKVFEKGLPNLEALKDIPPVEGERPFLSPTVWAAYSAYSAVIMFAVMQLKALASGTSAAEHLDAKSINQMLKTALPHFAPVIDTYGVAAHGQLLEPLIENLIKATNVMLEGGEEDVATMASVAEIIRLAEETKSAKAAVPDHLRTAQPAS